MKKLVIIGASAMGRETFAYASDCGMHVKGFLDSRKRVLDAFTGYPPILSSVEDYHVQEEDVFVCAIGEPNIKLHYATIITSRGGRFVTIIHPSAYIGMNVEIGLGCIICPKSVITNDSIIEDHVIVNVSASINHDNHIGLGATICPGCNLAGRVTIGASCFIATGSVLIPDVKLGEGVYVAAGSVVVKSYESGRIMGIPAKPK